MFPLRLHHTRLNKLLLRFLPLALPPHTLTPFLYYCGMSSFLPIYSTFESSFRALSSQNILLLHLHIPALERSSYLQHDLEQLAINLRLHFPALFDQSEKEDDDTSEDNPRLKVFVSHIRSCLIARPHLLVAYTWIFYMAIFSGGRYIRAKLQDAGNDFWACEVDLENRNESHVPRNPADPAVKSPLRFWSFAGAFDGEDLKADYKARILELELGLTVDERQEVVDEAVDIMCKLLEIVDGIDSSIATGRILTQPPKPTTTADKRDSPTWSTLLVKHLLPVGLAELLINIRARVISSEMNSSTPVAVAVAAKVE